MRSNLTCLLIDNDEEDHEIFDMALQELEGVQAVFFTDPVQALDRLAGDPDLQPDYIFIDSQMPRLSGLQCLQKLRANGRFSETPVYLYSTCADPSAVAEAHRIGVTGYLAKPVYFEDLVTVLRGILKPRCTCAAL